MANNISASISRAGEGNIPDRRGTRGEIYMSASPRRATSRNGFRFQILRVLPSFLLSFLPRRSCQTDWRRRRHAMQQRDDHRGVSSLAFRHRSPCPFGDGPRKGPQIYEMKVLLCRAIRHGERRISWSAVAFPFRSRITPTPLPRIEASYPSTIGIREVQCRPRQQEVSFGLR